MENLSPYLKDDNRLGDVIAAIQVMAVYKFYKLSFEDWADRISADVKFEEKWKKVFEEHPEFFRLDTDRKKASLVWRRQFPKRYNVDTERAMTLEDYERLTDNEKLRVSRNPLSPNDIKMLIDTAINLHSRALQHKQDKRWWVPLLITFIGGVLGAIVGGLLKAR